MFSQWLIRINNGTAYVHNRQYWMGLIAVPWALHGGTRIIFTPDTHNDVIEAALEYILLRDSHAIVQINFQPWT